MGLLENKSRIMDTILTLEGRRQIATGKLKAEFFSFSDSGVFYKLDTLSSSADIGKRIALEASSLPQDQVTFEADDSGRLVPFKGATVFTSRGKIVTIVTGVNGSVRDEIVELEDSQFASSSNDLLNSSLDSFNKLYTIGSPDLFDENHNEFIISQNNINFTITNDRPIPQTSTQTISVDHVESFFQDKRLSHLPNFNFLPPTNKANPGTTEKTPLGAFARIGQAPYLEYSTLKNELNNLQRIGFEQVINFTESSRENNLICQFFELSNGEVIKLDVIDFGVFFDGNESFGAREISKEEIEKAQKEGRELQLESQTKHVFFVGKIFKDNTGSHNFLNLFALVFEG